MAQLENGPSTTISSALPTPVFAAPEVVTPIAVAQPVVEPTPAPTPAPAPVLGPIVAQKPVQSLV
jgi:hypothetical protein